MLFLNDAGQHGGLPPLRARAARLDPAQGRGAVRRRRGRHRRDPRARRYVYITHDITHDILDDTAVQSMSTRSTRAAARRLAPRARLRNAAAGGRAAAQRIRDDNKLPLPSRWSRVRHSLTRVTDADNQLPESICCLRSAAAAPPARERERHAPPRADRRVAVSTDASEREVASAWCVRCGGDEAVPPRS